MVMTIVYEKSVPAVTAAGPSFVTLRSELCAKSAVLETTTDAKTANRIKRRSMEPPDGDARGACSVRNWRRN